MNRCYLCKKELFTKIIVLAEENKIAAVCEESNMDDKGDYRPGLLMAATVGVPLYVCGGGTIPLIQQWLSDGMSAGSAAAFMITGPATKITNLGALKIALGAKNFVIYLAFIVLFSLATGFAVNLVL